MKYFIFLDRWLNVKLSVFVHTPENEDPPVEGYTAAPASTIRLKASVTDQNGIPILNATVGVTVSDMRPWTAVQERHLPPRLLQVVLLLSLCMYAPICYVLLQRVFPYNVNVVKTPFFCLHFLSGFGSRARGGRTRGSKCLPPLQFR